MQKPTSGGSGFGANQQLIIKQGEITQLNKDSARLVAEVATSTKRIRELGTQAEQAQAAHAQARVDQACAEAERDALRSTVQQQVNELAAERAERERLAGEVAKVTAKLGAQQQLLTKSDTVQCDWPGRVKPPDSTKRTSPIDGTQHGIYNSTYTSEGHAMPTPSTPSRPKEAKLFRNNRSQAVRIPVEFELPGDRVLIHREGNKLVIEPVTRPTNIVELLAEWRKEAPLEPEDQLPAIKDMPAQPEDIF